MSEKKRKHNVDEPPEQKRPKVPEQEGEKKTRIVRLRRRNGQIVQGCDVYIGRKCTMGGWDLPQSKWANPFSIKECGSVGEAVKKYRIYILENQYLLDDLDELQGKVLGCWCKPGPCHGDVLVELIEKNKS